MKSYKFFLLILLILTFTFSAFSQRRFGGKVIQVIDGKTAVVQMSNGGKLTIILQYIEIPEPDQPLHQTVKEHLEKLILNQLVEINPRGLSGNATTIGQIFLKDVDISRQMLRDGAAWFAVLENGGQSPSESANYQSYESQAKAEKRGVWGIEGMKPAWEFRAAREEARQAAERAEFERIKNENQARQNAEAKQKERERQINSSDDVWVEIGGDVTKKTGLTGEGLFSGYESARKIRHVATPGLFIEILSENSKQMIESRLFYFSKETESKIEEKTYVLGILSTSKEYKFVKESDLVLQLDNQTINLGKAQWFSRKDSSAIYELLQYRMNRDQMMKIAKSKKIELQLGSFSGLISGENLIYVKKLINSSK